MSESFVQRASGSSWQPGGVGHVFGHRPAAASTDPEVLAKLDTLGSAVASIERQLALLTAHVARATTPPAANAPAPAPNVSSLLSWAPAPAQESWLRTHNVLAA